MKIILKHAEGSLWMADSDSHVTIDFPVLTPAVLI